MTTPNHSLADSALLSSSTPVFNRQCLTFQHQLVSSIASVMRRALIAVRVCSQSRRPPPFIFQAQTPSQVRMCLKKYILSHQVREIVVPAAPNDEPAEPLDYPRPAAPSDQPAHPDSHKGQAHWLPDTDSRPKERKHEEHKSHKEPDVLHAGKDLPGNHGRISQPSGKNMSV